MLATAKKAVGSLFRSVLTPGRPRRPALLLSLVTLVVLAAIGRRILAVGSVNLYVNAGSTCSSGCGSQASPYRTIQAAIVDANNQIIAAAATGAVIQVAAGNYPERIFIYPNIHVICAGTATTTINATGLGRSAVIFGAGGSGRPDTDFSIDGCKITGGAGEARNGNSNAGAGVFIFGDAVVSNNLITANTVSGAFSRFFGGGVYVATGTASIIGNTITKNTASPNPVSGSFGLGGGLFLLGPQSGVTTNTLIEANLIAENLSGGEVGKGAAVRVDGNPGTMIRRNMILGNRSNYGGGGIEAYSNLNVADNLIFGNSTGMYGGGIDLTQVTAQIINNTIFGNSVTNTSTPSGYSFATYGAGIAVETVTTQNPPMVTLRNNLVVGNTVTAAGTGGGVHTLRTTPFMFNNDIWNNIKQPTASSNVSGDFTDAQVIGVNGNRSANPLFLNAPLFTDVTVAAGSTTTVAVRDVARYVVNHKLEYNNDGVVRTITAINSSTKVITFTPALAAASVAFKMVSDWNTSTNVTEDFHLAPTSPALDTGSNTGASQYDLDGRARVQDSDANGTSIVDMGAYEVPVPDTDADGTPNPQDCAPTVNSVQTTPGVVADTVLASPSPSVTLTWLRIPQANVYNVYRGSTSGAFTYNHTCFESTSPDRATTDAAVPPVGTAYYYLVSGVNSCAGGEGSLGSSYPGASGSPVPRPNPNPCVVTSADNDADGVLNINDDCPLNANATQVDQELDGVGDVCDNCAAIVNPDQSDSDANGVGNHCQDGDTDGYFASVDCNDQNAAIHPGALETCNGVDDNCNGPADDGLGTSTCGIGACQRTVNNCVGGVPMTCTPGTPAPAETCGNGIDDDCNGAIDDGC
ncbi:MAG TPA: putative metal-binding motif-containing protein [Dongiaceae bacterium]|nr:putative metal-binding motif-containing protein [Dongiaceae bacterium]